MTTVKENQICSYLQTHTNITNRNKNVEKKNCKDFCIHHDNFVSDIITKLFANHIESTLRGKAIT